MRLTGFAVIENAEKHNLTPSKHPNPLNGPAAGLSVAEAESLADEDESLIYLDVPEQEYRSAAPTSFEPER